MIDQFRCANMEYCTEIVYTGVAGNPSNRFYTTYFSDGTNFRGDITKDEASQFVLYNFCNDEIGPVLNQNYYKWEVGTVTSSKNIFNKDFSNPDYIFITNQSITLEVSCATNQNITQKLDITVHNKIFDSLDLCSINTTDPHYVFDGLFDAIAARQRSFKEILKGMAFKESTFNACAENGSYYGLMQTPDPASKCFTDLSILRGVQIIRNKANIIMGGNPSSNQDINYTVYDNGSIYNETLYVASQLTYENWWKFTLAAYKQGQSKVLFAMFLLNTYILNGVDYNPYNFESVRDAIIVYCKDIFLQNEFANVWIQCNLIDDTYHGINDIMITEPEEVQQMLNYVAQILGGTTYLSPSLNIQYPYVHGYAISFGFDYSKPPR